MKTYSLLDKRIRKALSAAGFKNPTEIQSKAILRILDGKDILVTSRLHSILPVFQPVHRGGRAAGWQAFEALFV